jgi:hypothetical protein
MAKLASKLAEVLPHTGLKGPNIDRFAKDLVTVTEVCRKQAGGKLKNPELGGSELIILDDEPATPAQPVRKRAFRPTPPGTFQRGADRTRTLVYNGKQYVAESIAHGFCLIVSDAVSIVKGEVVGSFDAEGIAASIQGGYPENNYEPYRAYVDLKKYLLGVFACQREIAETGDDAVDLKG